MWHFQLVLCATLHHCPWTWRSLPTHKPPHPHANASFSPSWTTAPACHSVALWHHGTTWVVKTPAPVPFFLSVYPLSLSPLSPPRHRSSLIRGARVGTDWWCEQGAPGPMVVKDVRWDDGVRSGADLCWGQRRLDSTMPKSDSFSYILVVCVCVSEWMWVLECTLQ